jgi:hypothetical protein
MYEVTYWSYAAHDQRFDSKQFTRRGDWARVRRDCASMGVTLPDQPPMESPARLEIGRGYVQVVRS